MKRRYGLVLAAVGVMAVIGALAQPKAAPRLLLLEWAGKASAETPPTAILIEMGLKDAKASPWSGQATVTGARVVHREGYRFREGDKLTDPAGWVASSHRALRLPPKNPAAAALEGMASVGVVLHLADVKPEATLTLTIKNQEIKEVVVRLKDILAGQTERLQGGKLAVRLISTATPVITAKTEDDFPAACYGPDGTLWVAYISYTVKDDSRRIEAPPLKEQPKDFKAFYTPEFGDQLFVKYYKGGKWSEPIAITGAKEELARCAIAVDGQGMPWVVYTAHRDGKFPVFARPINNTEKGAKATPQPGAEERLFPSAGDEHFLTPVLATLLDGGLRLAVQCRGLYGNYSTSIGTMSLEKGKWAGSLSFSGGLSVSRWDKEGSWNPSIASGPNGNWAVAYDKYLEGDYDIFVVTEKTAKTIASTSRFEARPSIAYDPKGRLWIAYEEGPEQWGKNFGALDERGNPMYFARTVKVVCLQDGKLMRPVAELPPLTKRGESPDTGQKVEALPRYSNPQLGLDGKGRVWLTYRQKFGTRYTTHPGSYWLTFARRLDGDKWTPPIELHHSDGLLDSRPVVLPHPAGGIRVIHNTDNRYTTPDVVNNDIYMSYLDLPGDPVEPKLVPHEPGKKDEKLVQQGKAEAAAVARIRKYRVDAAGKKYQLLRGEFHRHTEISWDGGPDGSLEDMFRYAIDVAGMDWIGNGDHDNGAGREYSWWLTQKLTDAYHVKDRFTPMFTYERSVAYPHGHRNCMFARRGIRTLPRLAEADPDKRVGGIHADDTKMLYRYLRELDGICAVHTSATSMGTDWRDNDPVVEPIVEIYQGDRMSYEKQEAPRAGYDPKTGKKPANIAGWFPLGFVNLALGKGYRLGFQSSSDHFSTHISYCIVLAEKHDRAGILAALKKRHCYAATDDIILDVQSGGHVMGDEFKTKDAPALDIRVNGTNTLARVEVLRDSEVVESFKPGKREFQVRWTDPKPAAGVHYYYVRVQQTDGELAWGSPLWIDHAK